jgi:hypothetical protein
VLSETVVAKSEQVTDELGLVTAGRFAEQHVLGAMFKVVLVQKAEWFIV